MNKHKIKFNILYCKKEDWEKEDNVKWIKYKESYNDYMSAALKKEFLEENNLNFLFKIHEL